MADQDLEGDWVMGWPDRRRAQLMPSKDSEGRVIHGRSPVLDLEGLITPVDAFYIIAQLQMPDPIHPDDYRFTISGLVEQAAEYTIETLRRLPGKTVRAVTECAGNDGEFWSYLQPGSKLPKPDLRKKHNEQGGWTQMRKEDSAALDIEALNEAMPSTGLVSGGEWTGVPLRYVLEKAGVKPEAVSVKLKGWDTGRPDPAIMYASVGRTDFEVVDPGIINYEKALPIEKALDPDTILAWSHNGEYLTHVHGAPLRLVVPGWAGNWWVKWIESIELLDHMPKVYYQTHYFVSGKSPDDPNKQPMTQLGVKTLIKYPRDDDSPLKSGVHVVRGLAWSGAGKVVRVEVSTNGGESWNEAVVEESPDRWLWVRWSYVWEVNKAGHYEVMARATDENGRAQPQTPFNFQRKHFDGIVPERITIE